MFIEKGYKSDLLNRKISTFEKLDRNDMLKERLREKAKQTCIPIRLTYNRLQSDSKTQELTSHK